MDFEQCINYLLTVAQNRVFQRMSERLSEHDITPGQYGVLNCLWQKGRTTPKEIAQTLALESCTVSGVLDRMQKKELIERLLDPDDRRSIQVVATPKGVVLETPVLQIVEEVNAEILGQFTSEETAVLLRCLRQIAGSV